MFSRLTKAGLIAAVAGAAMQALAAAPAEAFTLGSPSPAPIVASADIDHVWYDQWGRWHPNHRWGPPRSTGMGTAGIAIGIAGSPPGVAAAGGEF